MKQLMSAFVLLVATTVSGFAVDTSDPKDVTQAFYDGYMKVLAANGDAVKYVMKSDALTPEFKKAYKAVMKRPEADPIIAGQDYPDAGFKASKVDVDGVDATVTMKSRDPAFDHSIQVELTVHEGIWQIYAIGDLTAE